MNKFAEVAVVGLHLQPLTYKITQAVAIGELVLVPVRNSKRLGVVISLGVATDVVGKIKPLEQLDSIIVPDNLLQLAQWMSSYYLTPIAEVLALMLPTDIVKYNAENVATSLAITPAGMAINGKQASKAQVKLLAWLKSQENYINNFSSCQDAGFSSASINACLKQSWLDYAEPRISPTKIELTSEQKAAVSAVDLRAGFQVFLLDGVTGSGKTEVYSKLIQKILNQGKQALVLVPEIGLTKQTVARFVTRCGQPALVLHSKISPKQKANRWLTCYRKQAKLVIGTRSALFVPMTDLGIIVIDEGHDASFKQQNTCCYSAKHTAIMLAKLYNIPIVLGSATPSLESFYKCALGSYKLLELKQRLLQKQPAAVSLVNLCNSKYDAGVPLIIKQPIADAIAAGEQVLVFINRRGYAAVLLCNACGQANKCTRCEANYILHNAPKELRCHHCERATKVPERCLNCGAKSWITAGIGTQKVETTLGQWYPGQKVIRVDRDNSKTTKQFNDNLAMINTAAANIIIGTQMLAKGHDFANIGLVVVLDSDAQLYNPDYKSQERLAQLLVQVAGRAGRRNKPGKILLPTHQPEHPVFSVLTKGYKHWATAELAKRKAYDLEPYIFSVVIHLQSQQQAILQQIKQEFHKVLVLPDVELIGPIANLRPKRKGYWRYIVILESKKRSSLHQQARIIRNISYELGWQSKAQWRFDIDPIDSD